jgi:plastocyanin
MSLGQLPGGKMKLARYAIIVALLVALIGVSTACGDDENESSSAGSGDAPVAGDTVAGGTAEVEMVDISFMPEEISVKVNGTVRWVNNDPVAHTVTDDADMFDSGIMDGDGTVFEHQYDKTGTYGYTCSIHPTTMTGIVIVEE